MKRGLVLVLLSPLHLLWPVVLLLVGAAGWPWHPYWWVYLWVLCAFAVVAQQWRGFYLIGRSRC